MAKVIINNQDLEALPGETLLAVARRNGAHIGFACDGNGLCTTCECQISLGSQFLSPVNSIERAQLAQSRLDRGYRLGCQASVRGPGPIEATARVEQLRRLAQRALGGPSAAARADARSDLLESLTELTIEHLSKTPVNVIEATTRLGLRMLWPFKNTQKWLEDGTKVVDSMRDPRLR